MRNYKLVRPGVLRYARTRYHLVKKPDGTWQAVLLEGGWVSKGHRSATSAVGAVTRHRRRQFHDTS